MPLIERYGDWAITDGSYDDPHTLAFDHRCAASTADLETLEASSKAAEVTK